MAGFACSRCGKCCQNFGSYLSIERELEEGHYYCRCSITGEYFYARMTRDIRQDPGTTTPSRGQTTCPFLFQEENGTFSCAIYPNRPLVCREYRCSTLDVMDKRGVRQGKVGGRRSLISTDAELSALWAQEIQPLHGETDFVWREKVKEILEKRGYRVVLYE
jgi:Fe-S-cluster containining protein